MTSLPMFVKITDVRYRCDLGNFTVKLQYTADNSHNWRPGDEIPRMVENKKTKKEIENIKSTNNSKILKSTKTVYCEKCKCDVIESDVTLDSKSGYYTHKIWDVQTLDYTGVVEIRKSEEDGTIMVLKFTQHRHIGYGQLLAGTLNLDELANQFNHQISGQVNNSFVQKVIKN